MGPCATSVCAFEHTGISPLRSETCVGAIRPGGRAAKSSLTEFVFHKANGDRWQDLSEGLDAPVRRAKLDLTAGPVTRENLASAVRTLEGFAFKSVITSKKPEVSVDTGRMTESAQVHGMLHVPAALLPDAGVVKLADARDSKSRGVHSP
jgi:hypothetical protein